MPLKTEPKEWTLMFYFASDNPLAPEIVSQLKALKNAGYHPDVNVVAYFDPQCFGPGKHIFDVNAFNKLTDHAPNIGFMANDTYVRGLMEDKLWGDEKNRHGKPIRELIQTLLGPDVNYSLPKLTSHSKNNGHSAKNKAGSRNGKSADESQTDKGPQESLKEFLELCATHYKANHYMLFILGHGLVVGDDVFLYDEHAVEHSVTLRQLGVVLKEFNRSIHEQVPGSIFELIGFHSCSMSSVEIAFELQGTAKQMLASQGPAFVGSWPYRQILIRVFKDVEKTKSPESVSEMIQKIFYYVYYNSMDFMLAGYSFDLCWCDLSRIRVGAVQTHLQVLSAALIESLKRQDEILKASILLAHWKSQSYWNDNYTDLYDFCFCLSDYCEKFIDEKNNPVKNPEPFKTLRDASNAVKEILEEGNPNGPIICAKPAGLESQYSHGLSVFFPWTRPIGDRPIVDEYAEYKFAVTDWLRFLEQYWGPKVYVESPQYQQAVKESTIRNSRRAEALEFRQRETTGPCAVEATARYALKSPGAAAVERDRRRRELREDIQNLMFNAEGPLNAAGTLNGGEPEKPNPQSSTGDQCACGSIKNFPRDTRARNERGKKANSIQLSGVSNGSQVKQQKT